ncbi:MAG: alpha/beta hydrolase [Chitinophagaceae bacterium]|nr:alpha/beta hydrolase [Chitinophagaceae bacterium]
MSEVRERSSVFSKGYALVNNLNLYHEIHGDGEPLVLLHGGGSTIQTSFGVILPMLAKHHKVIAVELQAHGHTKDRDTPESFEQDAADVTGLLSFLKIDKADVLGFSNGAQTALQLAIAYPQLLSKMVFISGFYKREGAFKGFFDGFPGATLDNMPVIYQEAYLAIEGNDSTGLQRMFEQDRQRMEHFKGWTDAQVASVKAPTLIISGDRDVATPEHLAEMVRTLPGARLMVLPAIHGSFIGEAMTPEYDTSLVTLTVKAIEDFLKK